MTRNPFLRLYSFTLSGGSFSKFWAGTDVENITNATSSPTKISLTRMTNSCIFECRCKRNVQYRTVRSQERAARIVNSETCYYYVLYLIWFHRGKGRNLFTL